MGNDMKNIPIQQGFALVAALIFMVLMSFIALGLSSMTSSEEKMARNFRDQDIAFAAAEAALRDAELHLTGAWRWPYSPVSINAFNATCAGGLCDSMVAQAWQPVDAIDFFGSTAQATNSVVIGTVTGSPTLPQLVAQPRYLIEAVPTALGSLTAVPQNRVFRITAQARGRFGNTRVVLQEIYVVSNLVK